VTPPDGTAPVALVVAADDEMRILLRGLLQLHRVRVDGEATGVTHALRLLAERRPTLLVVDSHLEEGSAVDLVGRTRATLPGTRVVLVYPASRPPPVLTGPSAPDVLLLRPFRIQQFADAIGPPADGPSAPSS